MSGAPSAAGDLASIVDGARKEGALNLVWSPKIAGTPEDFADWAAAFNKQYGLNLKVQYTPGGTFPQMAAQLVQEVQSNRSATSDVYLGSPTNVLSLVKAKAVQQVNWAAWAPNVKNPALYSSDGSAVEIELAFPGISYNTNLLKGDQVPKSLQDLLKPEFKGKVASTPYAAHFNELATPPLWGEQKTTTYLQALAKQVSGLIACGELPRVASGEFAVFALDCDAAIYYPEYMSVPVNSLHPNAAKLWINFVLSREGQDLMYKENFGDHPLVPGSKTAAQMQQITSQGVKFIDTNLDFFQTQPDNSKLRDQYQAILQGKA